ncbi:16S rRNA (uracil(1498)-N(3))-methyltransferase [uncultured Bifidobacterium sp.]|uniref:16S rRNA (uracil(1498)-N(3))-methyltransferase n=1 Tax=uncultured Bifidobacterium sp. TaxID=165187 RepID=UPI0028DD0C3B|nr:16S rRNA (uracil(1498)-N(3))-methyltransferase [uncultured Bifidobacterium sp.]
MTSPVFLLDPDHDDVVVDVARLAVGTSVRLPSRVRRHAVQAMRLAEGDEFDLVDGRGLRLRCALRSVAGAGDATATLLDVSRDPAPRTRLVLVQALAKSGHDEQAIDAATQIGVDEIVPWQARRSIARWRPGRTDHVWSRTLAAATEQSRRARTPVLADCVNDRALEGVFQGIVDDGGIVIVLHQDATATWSALAGRIADLGRTGTEDGARTRSIAVVVGPEGGIDEEEVAEFVAAGAESCALGPTIMRASVAGPAVLALLAGALGRFDAVRGPTTARAPRCATAEEATAR